MAESPRCQLFFAATCTLLAPAVAEELMVPHRGGDSGYRENTRENNRENARVDKTGAKDGFAWAKRAGTKSSRQVGMAGAWWCKKKWRWVGAEREGSEEEHDESSKLKKKKKKQTRAKERRGKGGCMARDIWVDVVVVVRGCGSGCAWLCVFKCVSV